MFKRFFLMSTNTAGRKVKAIYLTFRIIVVIMLLSQLIMLRWGNLAVVLITLVAFTIPYALEQFIKIAIPNVLEIIIISFIFSFTILGELSDFYVHVPFWDTAQHTLAGFLSAGIGFSLIYLLNTNAKGLNLTPIFLALVTFCFSMTIGVMWEFIEFSADKWIGLDMQKDTIIQQVNTARIEEGINIRYQLDDIVRTTIESKNETGFVSEMIIDNGYLDIGIIDTMKDLFVNLIGAVTFSVFSFLYSRHEHKRFGFIQNFMIKNNIVDVKEIGVISKK